MSSDKLFKALSDKTRRQIITLLREQDMTAGDIASHFNMSKPSISEHLKILRNADVVFSEKQGQYIMYSLNATVLHEMVSFFMNLVDRNGDKEGN
jgi:ArsR family transcriptional regulator, arsenate/arsenite/antimonite-responsive transcriptional repressor